MVGMRLQCYVLVVRRGAEAKAGSPISGCIAIGDDKETKTVAISISTKTNVNGTKFPVKDNLVQTFEKCVSEGKMTLRFKEPPCDILISKAAVPSLKMFLEQLRMTESGQESKLGRLGITKSRHVKPEKSALKIRDKKQYYSMQGKGFPRTLTQLELVGVELNRVDSRWCQLSHLTVLELNGVGLGKARNLSSLSIASFPDLKVLSLSANGLCRLPSNFWEGLSPGLTQLNLSKNRLREISPLVRRLRSLSVLDLRQNQLRRLPSAVGCLPALRFLNASNNQISAFPMSLKYLKLSNIDVTRNHPDSNVRPPTPLPPSAGTHQTPSLNELAFRAVKDFNLCTDGLPTAVRVAVELTDFDQCAGCGRRCVSSSVWIEVLGDLRCLASTVVTDSSSGFLVRFAGSCCSFACWHSVLKSNSFR